MNRAKTLHISGTGSGVGKSVIVSGLCRIFLQDGHKVCPFKAQNMALNSFVTKEGGEIGRAQALQALACRVEPHVDMNPILMKPAGDRRAQIIVHGKPLANMSAVGYVRSKKRLSRSTFESFDRLSKQYEMVVMEGAGSPAEVNLKSHDIVNLKMARYADAPVILVGDIDKGGVFAHLVGTLELLDESERRQIKGFIINKFRGDKRLLKSGIDFLEKRTGIKVLGIIPYFKDIRLPEEDSVTLENRIRTTNHEPRTTKLIDIAVIKLPHISNFTDFDALANERDVRLHYVKDGSELDDADVIIIPGTKSTISDLEWLKKTGLARLLLSTINYKPSTTLIGICGGYQMLGEKIRDPKGVESDRKELDALGLLPIATDFEEDKILSQIKANEIGSGLKVTGYEIHHGRTKNLKPSKAIFEIVERQARRIKGFDGTISTDGRIWGTYIHGIFDEDAFRRDFLNRLRARKGLVSTTNQTAFDLDKELDKLAKFLRENINMKLLYRIMNYES